MKQLELKLQKRLLIMEIPDNTEALYVKDVVYKVTSQSNEFALLPWGSFKLICKGSELTEEIAMGFVEYDGMFEAYQYYHDTVPIMGNTALNLLKTAIKNHGYYWDKPNKLDFYKRSYVGLDRIAESFDYENYDKAISCTFNPEKTLIFEIL